MSKKANRYQKTQRNDSVVNFKDFKRNQKKVLPRNLEQEKYLDLLADDSFPIVVAHGPAGTGKSFLACAYAAELLARNEIERIVVTRPNLAIEGEEIGFLPGDVDDKMIPWIMPIYDSLMGLDFSKAEIDNMVKSGVISVVPIAQIRGRTFNHAFIIADECQNLSPVSMLSLLTRIGEESKMVLAGDTKQSDRKDDNGLMDLLDRIDRIPGVADCRLVKSERHPMIDGIIQAYED